MLNHYLLHTFTTHLPFSQITNSIKTNPVLYFNKTDYPKLNNPLGNAGSHLVRLPRLSNLLNCNTLLLHTLVFFITPIFQNPIQLSLLTIFSSLQYWNL